MRINSHDLDELGFVVYITFTHEAKPVIWNGWRSTVILGWGNCSVLRGERL